MSLKAIISAEEHGKLAKELQGEYSQAKDGRFVLAVDPVDGWGLEDVAGLKTTLAKEREAAKKSAELLEAFKDLDPKAARDALTKVEKMKDWTPDEKVKETIKAREDVLTRAHAEEVKKLSDRNAFLTGALSEHLIDAEVGRALNGKASVELLLPIIKGKTRVDEKDGKFQVVVLDESGTPRMTMKRGADGRTSTDNMGLEEFALSLKENPKYAPAFFGSGHSGSGAAGSSSGGSGGSGRFTITESRARDPQEYQRVRAEASKAGAQVEVVPG